MSDAAFPVARAKVAMGACQNDSVKSEGRVHNDEWKFEAANNLFLPRGFRIFIDGVVKTVDQTASQIRTRLVG